MNTNSLRRRLWVSVQSLLFAVVLFGGLASSFAAPSATKNLADEVSVVIDQATTVTVTVHSSTAYRLTLSAGSWVVPVDPGLSRPLPAVLEITKADVSKIEITDLGVVAAAVTFNGSGTETFEDDFVVDLDAGATAGAVTFGAASPLGAPIFSSRIASGTAVIPQRHMQRPSIRLMFPVIAGRGLHPRGTPALVAKNPKHGMKPACRLSIPLSSTQSDLL